MYMCVCVYVCAASDTVLFPGMFRADGMCVGGGGGGEGDPDDLDSSALQFDAESAAPAFQEFFDDVFEEMSKFGRIINFKVPI
jgi:hypothetical protein